MRGVGLRSPLQFACRLEAPVIVAWLAGAAATGLVLGVVAHVAAGSVPASVTDLLDKFGVHESGFGDSTGMLTI